MLRPDMGSHEYLCLSLLFWVAAYPAVLGVAQSHIRAAQTDRGLRDQNSLSRFIEIHTF